jgi:hypothetical protein
MKQTKGISKAKISKLCSIIGAQLDPVRKPGHDGRMVFKVTYQGKQLEFLSIMNVHGWAWEIFTAKTKVIKELLSKNKETEPEST